MKLLMSRFTQCSCNNGGICHVQLLLMFSFLFPGDDHISQTEQDAYKRLKYM